MPPKRKYNNKQKLKRQKYQKTILTGVRTGLLHPRGFSQRKNKKGDFDFTIHIFFILTINEHLLKITVRIIY